MTTLTHKVELARANYDMRQPSEKRASKLLIGKEEQAELIALAEEWGYFIKPHQMLEKAGEKRVEFHGLKVYKVDDESYCEVAP